MKKLKDYSKGIHVIAMCCFLLPFFQLGCQKEKPVEVAENDVSAVIIDSSDLKIVDSSAIVKDKNIKQVVVKDAVEPEKKSEFISQQLSEKYTFLQPILVSDKDQFSGMAVVIDALSYISFFATFLSFLFLFFAFLLKFIEPKATRTIVLMDIIAFICLNISAPIDFFWERMWGCWTAIIVVIVLMIVDLYILKLIWKNESVTNS